MTSIFCKKYNGEEINDINDDILESLNSKELETDEYGFFKGYIKVSVEYVEPGDCECVGFQHKEDCPNWEISY